MRFYSYSLEDALSLDWDNYLKLVKAMGRIKAKDWLQTFELNCVPKMDKKDREKVRKRLYKQAYPENFKKENVAKNLSELAAKIRGSLGGK